MSRVLLLAAVLVVIVLARRKPDVRAWDEAFGEPFGDVTY